MNDQPYPDYTYDDAAAKRAQALQASGREVVDAIGGSLFDTDPAQIAKTLAALSAEQQS
jgi:hypothetical protein